MVLSFSILSQCFIVKFSRKSLPLHSNQCLINNNANHIFLHDYMRSIILVWISCLPYRVNKLTSCTNYKLNHAKYTFCSAVLVYMCEGDCLINNYFHPIIETQSIGERKRVVQYAQMESNGMALKPLVFHWWNASHCGDLEY